MTQNRVTTTKNVCGAELQGEFRLVSVNHYKKGNQKMYKVRMIIQFVVMVAMVFWWQFLADAQSACEEQPTEQKNKEQELNEGTGTAGGENNSGTDKPKEDSKKKTKDGREIDFFIGGDDNLQSLNFEIELPFDENPFKFVGIFEGIEGSFSGESFMTFKKPNLSEDTSAWEKLWKEYSDMEFASRSYTLRVEGGPRGEDNFLRRLGGYVELESDYSVDIDPNLHFTGYAQWSPFTFLEVAVGGWGEVRRVGQSTRWMEIRTEVEQGKEKEIEVEREVERSRLGLRGQLDLKHNTERTHFCMEIEFLPSIDEYRVNISPEFEYRFDLFEKRFGLVLHLEIGYYSQEKDFKIEPLTQLIRYSF